MIGFEMVDLSHMSQGEIATEDVFIPQAHVFRVCFDDDQPIMYKFLLGVN